MEMGCEVKIGVCNGKGHSYVRPIHVFLRLLALFATLAATIVMVLSKETAIVPVVLAPRLPPLQVIAPAKYNYSSAFVYFVVANAIACAYASISLIIGSLRKAATSKSFLSALCIIDLIMVALVSTGTGAATAIGIVGMQGNSHMNWNKVCDHFGRFCSQVTAAIAVSMIGILTFLLLIVASIVGLHQRSL